MEEPSGGPKGAAGYPDDMPAEDAELGRSDVTNQRVLLLYDIARRPVVSRLISGNAHRNCTTYPYRDAGDLLRFVETFMAPVPGC